MNEKAAKALLEKVHTTHLADVNRFINGSFHARCTHLMFTEHSGESTHLVVMLARYYNTHRFGDITSLVLLLDPMHAKSRGDSNRSMADAVSDANLLAAAILICEPVRLPCVRSLE